MALQVCLEIEFPNLRVISFRNTLPANFTGVYFPQRLCCSCFAFFYFQCIQLSFPQTVPVLPVSLLGEEQTISEDLVSIRKKQPGKSRQTKCLTAEQEKNGQVTTKSTGEVAYTHS